MSTETVTAVEKKHRFLQFFSVFFPQRRIIRILLSADLAALSSTELAKSMGARSPAAISRLWKRMKKTGDTLLRQGKIDSTRRGELAEFLKRSDPLAVSEALSPYHSLLSEQAFYQTSDAATRQSLRRSMARFARRHRLPPESAALLWKGEIPPPSRLPALLLLLPLPPALALTLFIASALPLTGVFLLFFTLPALFTAGYLLAAAILRKLLPSAPLPLLQNGAGHSVLTVGIGPIKDADAALEGMARIAAAGHGDCRYLLVLTLPDHVIGEAAGEREQIAALRSRVDALGERLDLSISLLVPNRRYDSRKKRWRGKPDFSELIALLARNAQEFESTCEAVCILPADAAILPGGMERLGAALFHPLCKADSLVFLSPARSPLPKARLSTLRQCLLQKFDAPADLPGWGIYRTEALLRYSDAPGGQAEGQALTPRLVSQPLFSHAGGEQVPYCTPIRQTPSLLPILRWLLPAVYPILLWGMVAAGLSISHCLLLWLAASADLIASALLSLRLNRRFFLYTLPAWKRVGIAFVHRTFLPVSGLWTSLGGKSLAGLSLVSLLFGGTVIATGAPFAFLGLCWCIAPLLAADTPLRPRLTSEEKAACHALATELYPLLQESGDTLPPAYLTEKGERAPYTTPIAMGTRLAAELSACDLGLIDTHTLERRMDALVSRIEKLPTRGGLPYARYSLETGDYYKDSRIDTVACGIYALCLASVEAGLLERASRQPGLYASAKRIAHLSTQMDFTLLVQADHTLCRTLTPTGEQEGELSSLFGGGGIALLAALSSDSTFGMGGGEKSAAWQRLRSPAVMRKGHCLIASEKGLLEEYLLLSLLLPTPEGSLLSYGIRKALKTVKREAKPAERLPIRERMGATSRLIQTTWQRLHFLSNGTDSDSQSPTPTDAPSSNRAANMGSLRTWPRLSRRPHPMTGGSPSLCESGEYMPKALTAPLLCMMLGIDPRLALSHLQKLQQERSAGGFADPARHGQIPMDGVSLGMIALGGAVTGRAFSARLMALPRCGALYPLLYSRPDAAIEGAPTADTPSIRGKDSIRPPSVCLLGDARHGLLMANGRGIALWEGETPLTAPASANGLFAHGRMSGLILLREGRLLPLPFSVSRREAGLLTLGGEEMTCRILRGDNGWSLCWERTEAVPDQARFLFCPAVTGSVRLSEETISAADGSPLLCLCMEYSPTLTVVIAVEGLADAFTHADSAPFPRGQGQIGSILSLTPSPAEGLLASPACMIGGRFAGKTLTVRIVCAVSPQAALASLCKTPFATRQDGADLPLPAPDGSLAARVLEWQIASIFGGKPIPAAMAAGGTGSDRDHLDRCLAGGKNLLTAKGFPAAAYAPLPLTVSRREGAEALIVRLLSDTPPDAETPLLPPKGAIRYPGGFPAITRGRDLPHLARLYHNGIAALCADPEALRLRLYADGEELTLRLYLTQEGKQWLLPAAATEVVYSPAEAIFIGEGFTLRMALLPRLPLLAIRLAAEGSGELSLPTLPPPHRNEEEDALWYHTDGKVLFCRRLIGAGETVWLIGSFPRAHDHLYYWMREAITLRSLSGIVESYDGKLRNTASLLRIEGEDTPPLPGVLAAVMSSASPVRALISPLCAPENATADLVRLAKGAPTLLLPMALLIRIAVTDDCNIANLRIPTEGGRASIYFLAARCLERAMAEDTDHPLLPPLVAAFARLAERIGDLSGLAHYSAFETDHQPASLRQWNALPDVSPETVEVLAALQWGEGGAASAAWDAIQKLPTDPNPIDAALLWCGVLWGALGFIPHRDGFTLAPLPAEKEAAYRLSYKGDWRIRLAPDAPPICTRGDLPQTELPQTEEKIFRKSNISRKTVAFRGEIV